MENIKKYVDKFNHKQIVQLFDYLLFEKLIYENSLIEIEGHIRSEAIKYENFNSINKPWRKKDGTKK